MLKANKLSDAMRTAVVIALRFSMMLIGEERRGQG